MFITFKIIHISTAVLSLCGFVVRGIWMMQSSQKLQHKWVKVVPHINDSILLVSAIVLVILSSQYPIWTTWINAKLFALLAYIVLGSIALKRGKNKAVCITAWWLAIFVFIYILGVATTKNLMIL